MTSIPATDQINRKDRITRSILRVGKAFLFPEERTLFSICAVAQSDLPITQHGWSAFLTVIAGKQDCFFGNFERGGPGLPGAPRPLIDQWGCWRKNFQK